VTSAVHHVCGVAGCVDPGHLLLTSIPVAPIVDPVKVRDHWRFGDVVRVDPTKNPMVPQPDDRRWMVLVPANTSAARQWTLLYIGPFEDDPSRGVPGAYVSHWSSMYGFERVEVAP
jgi:hypothetical protein